VLGGQLSKCRKKVRCGRYDTHVARDRLDNDAGELLVIGFDELLNSPNVIIGRGQGVFRKILRYTR